MPDVTAIDLATLIAAFGYLAVFLAVGIESTGIPCPGETTLVRDFVAHAFAQVDVEIEWRSQGADEKGVDAKTGRVLVEVDPRYFRPTEVDLLIGDPGKAHRKLGWKHKTGWRDLCAEMVAEDLKLIPQELHKNAD